jgi:hypothetical protein
LQTILGSSPKARSPSTKSPKYESLEKCDNTKLEGVQLQDEGTLFAVWDLHHKGVASMLNLKMTSKVVFHSLVQLEAYKMWSCATP